MMAATRWFQHTIALAVVFLTLMAAFTAFFDRFYSAHFTFDLDYSAHHHFAIVIENGKQAQLRIPHVLYHVVLVVIKNTANIEDSRTISVFLAALFRALLGVGLFVAIKYSIPKRLPNTLVAVITILLLWISPIYFWYNPPTFIGYINSLPYHNPTQNLMLVFVIPASLIALRAILPQPFKSLNRRIFFVLFSLLIILSLSLSKPSYSIALLPALGLLVLYRSLRRLPVDWALLIVGIGAPVAFMLAVQYVVTYTETERFAIAVGWLEFFRYRELEDSVVFARLALSVVFPVVVYALHCKAAWKDSYLNLAWLVFGVSLIWSYLLYEQGDRIGDGNFVWSAYAALFVLMFSTVLFLIKQYATQPFKLSWRLGLSIAAFLLHLGSGFYTAIRVIAGI